MLAGHKPGGGYEKVIIRIILGIHIHSVGRYSNVFDLWPVDEHQIFARAAGREGPQRPAAERRLPDGIYAPVRRPVRRRKIDRLSDAASRKLDREQQLRRQPLNHSRSIKPTEGQTKRLPGNTEQPFFMPSETLSNWEVKPSVM